MAAHHWRCFIIFTEAGQKYERKQALLSKEIVFLNTGGALF
jgi:hypothetical protein